MALFLKKKKEEIEVKEEYLEEINIKIVFLIPQNPYLDPFFQVNHPFKEPAQNPTPQVCRPLPPQ